MLNIIKYILNFDVAYIYIILKFSYEKKLRYIQHKLLKKYEHIIDCCMCSS